MSAFAFVHGACFALTLALSPSAETPLPIDSGRYVFEHRYAEHPDVPSIRLDTIINGFDIVLINDDDSGVFPKGVIDEGKLMWHAASGQWIVGHDRIDAAAPEVGGCSDGPAVIDLEKRIYWTC